MAVAKSYQALTQIGEPYELNGKMYVKVQAKSGAKQVRWYTDREYAKMYPEDKSVLTSFGEDKKKSPYWRSQKDVLGFEEGFIWIFKGDTYATSTGSEARVITSLTASGSVGPWDLPKKYLRISPRT